MSHWFQPVTSCDECGREANADNHRRKCVTVMSGGRPGFGFCRLVAGHEDMHEYVWWDGTVTRWLGGVEEVMEAGRCERFYLG